MVGEMTCSLPFRLLIIWYTESRSLPRFPNARSIQPKELKLHPILLIYSSLQYKHPQNPPFHLALKISSSLLLPFSLMGHPSISHGFVLPRPVVMVILLIDYIQFTFSLILYHIGLWASSEAPLSPWEDYAFYFQAADLSSTTTSVSVTPSLIKSKLRIVEFSSLSKRNSAVRREEETACVVCLGELEKRQKVRELGNCSHGFHVECIDKWLDAGRMTCPLCRSKLLPQEGRKERRAWSLRRVW